MDQLRRVCSVFLCFLMLVLPAISADQQAGQINALIPAATRNAQPATEFFKLPPNRVVELGMHVEM